MCLASRSTIIDSRFVLRATTSVTAPRGAGLAAAAVLRIGTTVDGASTVIESRNPLRLWPSSSRSSAGHAAMASG